MNQIVTISLLSETTTYDEMGVPVTTELERELTGNYQSVSAQEFFRGGENGIKPECVIKIWAAEYQKETLLELDGERYVIYRTYLNNDGRIELYCQKDVGA